MHALISKIVGIFVASSQDHVGAEERPEGVNASIAVDMDV
jgi:hypothetical protein